MAEEVYKILQSRLRKQAQHNHSACGDQYECDGCRRAKQQLEDSTKRKRPSSSGEDPLSHKIIEKRRRDRMNSCLADLSHLIPSNYLKKGRGRIEKTEIVEMAIKHIKHLHDLIPSTPGSTGVPTEDRDAPGGPGTGSGDPDKVVGSNWQCPQEVESFKNGFNECLAESVHFLVEKEHIPPENPLCSRLVGHLKRYLDHQKPGHHHHQHHSLNETTDSDYSSLRSESSAANSEVSSIVSNQSSTASAAVGASNSGNPGLASSKRHHNPTGRISTSTSSGSMSQSNPMSESSGSNLSGKRRSSEEVSGGKFKFKDSIRERFSHEFESQAENATATSDHFTGSSAATLDLSAARVSDPYFKRRRLSRSCDHPEDVKSGTSQQQTSASGTEDKVKNVPIFALHPKGSHYIPLSVTEDVIQPCLHLFEQTTELPLMLHPITISVNFCGPIRIASEVRQQSFGNPTSSGLKGPEIPTIKEDRE